MNKISMKAYSQSEARKWLRVQGLEPVDEGYAGWRAPEGSCSNAMGSIAWDHKEQRWVATFYTEYPSTRH